MDEKLPPTSPKLGLPALFALGGLGSLGIVFALVSSCQDNKTVAMVIEPTRRAIIYVEILDHSEDGLLGAIGVDDAELMLRITPTQNPNISTVFPLNVGTKKGLQAHMLKTPYTFKGSSTDSLMIELLDDDTLSEETYNKLIKASADGAYLLHVGAELFAISHFKRIPVDGRKTFKSIGKSTGKALLKDFTLNRRKSYGHLTYHINGKQEPTALRDAREVVLLDKKNKPRLKLKIYWEES